MPADFRRLRNLRIGATKDWNDQPVTNVKEITIGNTTDEDGFLKIFGKDGDAFVLGDATHEGGDIRVKRDTANNDQLFVDADAASNAIAMSVYGGVVAQNFLTVGQTALYTTRPFYVVGDMAITGYIWINTTNRGLRAANNLGSVNINIPITAGTATHSIGLQIDSSNILAVQATGDDFGGITNKAVGFFAVAPQVQQAHIADAAAAAGDPPTQAEYNDLVSKFNQLKADIEGFGFNAGP